MRPSVLLTLMACLIAGCAHGKVQKSQQFLPDEMIRKPNAIYIYNFATEPGEALADTFGPEYASDSMSEDVAERKADFLGSPKPVAPRPMAGETPAPPFPTDRHEP